MLEIGFSSKSYWKNSSPLLTSCCNSFSSIDLDTRTSCDCPSTKGCYNSSSSSFYEITITCGASFVVEVVVLLKKFNVASNSSSNSLLLCSCSKTLLFCCCRCVWNKWFYINCSSFLNMFHFLFLNLFFPKSFNFSFNLFFFYFLS